MVGAELAPIKPMKEKFGCSLRPVLQHGVALKEAASEAASESMGWMLDAGGTGAGKIRRRA
jgi:hypothetical protein